MSISFFLFFYEIAKINNYEYIFLDIGFSLRKIKMIIIENLLDSWDSCNRFSLDSTFSPLSNHSQLTQIALQKFTTLHSLPLSLHYQQTFSRKKNKKTFQLSHSLSAKIFLTITLFKRITPHSKKISQKSLTHYSLCQNPQIAPHRPQLPHSLWTQNPHLHISLSNPQNPSRNSFIRLFVTGETFRSSSRYRPKSPFPSQSINPFIRR